MTANIFYGRDLPAGPTPSDVGYHAWTFDLGSAAITASGLTNQRVEAQRVYLPASFTCSTVTIAVITAGSSVTYGRLALYDEAGTTLLGITGDLASDFNSVGKKTGTLGTPVALDGGPERYVYVAVLSDGGTAPALAFAHNLGGGTASAVNDGFSPARLGIQTGQTEMPASLTLSVGNRPFWVALG